MKSINGTHKQTGGRPYRLMAFLRMIVLVPALVLMACEEDTITGPVANAPTELTARYEWLLEGWLPGDQPEEPVGDPSVQLDWNLPEGWDGESFRVYAGRAGDGGNLLIGTVTSCARGECLYTDINVAPGRAYDYYVVAVDERRDRESPPSNAVRVEVPVFDPPPVPVNPTVTARDNALLLRWEDGGAGDNLQKYLVFLVGLNDQSPSPFYQVGETDGTGFLDLRTVNGNEYTYRIAAVDFDGHISRMSAPVTGTPRAETSGALIYEPGVGLSLDKIGVSDAGDPVIPMDGAAARGRLEVVDGRYVLRDGMTQP